jgi:Fe-S cluster assembly scaffold protein SufB
LEVFPDAKCIHTYRDPLKVLPSFFSMVYHSRRVFSDEVSKEVAARHWLRKNKHGVDKAMKYWNQYGEEKFMHVSYYHMLQHAEEEMRKIYAFSGLAADEKVLAGMQAVNEENKQHKYGVHRYDLKDFNVSVEEIDEAFADYRKKFNIPYE